jgi:hypothetical protein
LRHYNYFCQALADSVKRVRALCGLAHCLLVQQSSNLDDWFGASQSEGTAHRAYCLGIKLDRIQTDSSDPALYPISRVVSHIFYRILEPDRDYSNIGTYLIYVS